MTDGQCLSSSMAATLGVPESGELKGDRSRLKLIVPSQCPEVKQTLHWVVQAVNHDFASRPVLKQGGVQPEISESAAVVKGC